LERANLRRAYSSTSPPSRRIAILAAITRSTVPALRASSTSPASVAARNSIPVPTYGASLLSKGTACRCMFAPMSALLASSCSRNGIRAVATETVCKGATSM
jgi:hypothetical protein